MCRADDARSRCSGRARLGTHARTDRRPRFPAHPIGCRAIAAVPSLGEADVDVEDDLHLRASVLTYISDMFTGLFSLTDVTLSEIQLTSLDHSIWFYRPIPLDRWMLMDLIAESIASGRGMYRGRIFGDHGCLIAGLTQESLHRTRRPKG
jgi:acyl-CoA thioesterase